jgi:hypothetical protein
MLEAKEAHSPSLLWRPLSLRAEDFLKYIAKPLYVCSTVFVTLSLALGSK